MEDGALRPAELSAWRSFLRAHARVTRALEAELLSEQDLPLGSYDVLVQLVEAPCHRMRMTELADRVLLSRSGLTRLVDRLERDGLVRRERCPSDARGTLSVLTDAGLDRLRGASGTHLRGVREHVTGRLDEAELETLRVLLDKLLGAAEPPGAAGGCGGADTGVPAATAGLVTGVPVATAGSVTSVPAPTAGSVGQGRRVATPG